MTNSMRNIFYLSDGTGITAENLGHSLISQFDKTQFEHVTLSYVDSIEKANVALATINKAATESKSRPIIFATLVNEEIRKILASADALFIDVFNTFIGPLEQELKIPSSYRIGRSHAVPDESRYTARIEAIDFTLSTDDGNNTYRYNRADIILIGVSRSGKTPTSLYLAMQGGLLTANYPITADDLRSSELPQSLQKFKEKLFGLTIDPDQLHAIRTKRRPGSHYADLSECEYEVKQAERWFKEYRIPYLNTTSLSIEEIATRILAQTGLKRRAF